MKQGWYSILTKMEQDNSNSFIGGNHVFLKMNFCPYVKFVESRLHFFSDSFPTRTYVGRKIFGIFLLYMYTL